MFFNKSKKLLLSAWLLLGGLALSSCSSFFGDSGYLITNLTTRVDEDGNTIVTITFDDEDISPVTFTIPKGISGEPGVGIASITPKFDSEKQIVTLTITYTDETLEPTVIEVPVISGIDGKNGKGITNVIIGKDEIGNTTFQFQYSDNTTSEVFTINKGVDGIGIKDITNEYDADNNRIAITITYTNDETTTLYVSCGEDGNGIEGITGSREQISCSRENKGREVWYRLYRPLCSDASFAYSCRIPAGYCFCAFFAYGRNNRKSGKAVLLSHRCGSCYP